MLFPYTYVPHKMDKMQEFIDFIFSDVWCKAPGAGPFDLNLFAAKPELRELMEAFFYSDAKGADFFYGHVERIYGLFAALGPEEIAQFARWYQGDNDIEKVCANDPVTQIARYVDLRVANQILCDQLASFFKGLYSQSLLDLAPLREKIGDIDDHYKSFVKINKAGKCPFCGVSDMLGQYNTKREAYDHYLPKALYPFNSINFKNLVPACHQCNSSYKTSKDPAHPVKDPAGAARRRKIFYPYRADAQSVQISISVAHTNIDDLNPEDLSFDFGPVALAEELATWRDVYGIEERYSAKILSENDGKYWITQALDEWPSKGGTPEDYLVDMDTKAKSKPFAECNFLKNAYLQGCHKVGIF